MNQYALGGVGLLVLALPVMFVRFGIGAPSGATRGGDARRSTNGRPRLD